MAVECIPVRARHGSVVHATALSGDRLNVALCGRGVAGYFIDEGPVTCAKCVAVQRTKPTRAVRQDPSDHWRGKLVKLAGRVGYPPREMWSHWSQLALEIEFVQRITRPLCEAQAFRLIEWSVTRVGGEAVS